MSQQVYESRVGMKAITLHQPWATLIAVGEKRVETRSWGTSYRGPIAIHAGKTIDCDAYWEFDALLANAGFWNEDALPTGEVIAIATLSDCVLMTPEWISSIDADERTYGWFAPGRYGWVLTDVRQIKPIVQRGFRGLWNWEVVDVQAR